MTLAKRRQGLKFAPPYGKLTDQDAWYALFRLRGNKEPPPPLPGTKAFETLKIARQKRLRRPWPTRQHEAV
jgi:hypothetical protein